MPIVLVDSPDLHGDEAIERTASIARDRGSAIRVVAPTARPSRLLPGATFDVPGAVRDAHARHAQATAAALRAQGLTADVAVPVGDPTEEIVREVQRVGAELVVKLEGGGRQRRPGLGSLDLRLLRQCPSEVLICRVRDRVPYRRVAAAVDPSDDRPDRDRHLDVAILERATELARLDRARLLVLHAFDFPLEGFLRHGRVSLPPETVDAHVEDERDASRERLEALLAAHDPEDVVRESRIVNGPPEIAIAEAVERERADLLVLGTVARSGIAGLLIGNTGEQLVHDVGCAILAVKPAGFVSTVRAG